MQKGLPLFPVLRHFAKTLPEPLGETKDGVAVQRHGCRLDEWNPMAESGFSQ
jgi:hypothetical protein